MSDTFARVSNTTLGYAPQEVDEFLQRARFAYDALGIGDTSVEMNEDQVRHASFSFVRGGYDSALVDAALDRLESAFVQRRRAQAMSEDGEEKWLSGTYAQAETLYPRLLRPQGERFAHASGRGYQKAGVDELLDRIAAYFDGKDQLTSSEIRQATFPAARGHRAYNEAVVDEYLDRAVSVLLSVE